MRSIMNDHVLSSMKTDITMSNFEVNPNTVMTNLVAGIGDGRWNSRAGVVINPSPLALTSTKTINTGLSNGTNKNLPFNNPYHFQNNNAQNILLSPQHFITTANGSNDSMTESNVIANGPTNTNLANLDISLSNFTKAVNFDALMDDGKQLQNGDVDDNFEEQSLASDISTEVDVPVEDSKEQTQLMERFKQLKHWQMKQQELLMRQQQQQLVALREEQERVQKMIEKQREYPSGNDVPQPAAFALQQYQQNVLHHLPPKSPKKSPKSGQRISQSNMQQPKGVFMQSRPVPNIPSLPSTPSEYRMYGNPNLDSDTASTCTTNKEDLEEAFQPLGDTASDGSEQPNLQNQVHKNEMSGNHKGEGNTKLPPLSSHLQQVTKQGELDLPRKILTFDDTDTDSQPDLASLHNGSAHQQSYSNGVIPGTNQFHHNSQPQVSVNDQFPPGYVNLLSMPAMLQTLPGAMLQQLIALQQQGQTVIVNDEGQMIIYQYPTHQNQIQNQRLQSNNHYLHEQLQSQQNEEKGQSNTIESNVTNSEQESLQHSSNARPSNSTIYDGNSLGDNQILSKSDQQVISCQSDDEIHSHYGDDDTENNVNEIQETNEYEEEDISNDLENDDDQQVEEQQKDTNLDEQPVGGFGGRKKTFEELLEEELQREQQRMNTEAAPEPKQAVVPQKGKKQFLKKGQGLARFSGQGKPASAKSANSKRNSHHSVSGSSKAIPSAKVSSNHQGPSTNATAKKGETNRKTAPLKSTQKKEPPKKPLEKLKLKPSPKKPARKTVPTKNDSQTLKEPPKIESHYKTKQVKLKTKGVTKGQVDKKKEENIVPGREPDESVISAGEISFQNRLNVIAQKEEVEVEELQEFEILEQFADDNVSFLSNVSAVNRVLHQKKGHPMNTKNNQKKRTLVDDQIDEDETLAEEISSDEEVDASNSTLVEVKNTMVAETVEKTSQISSETNNPILAKLQSLKTIQRKIVTKDDRTTKVCDLESSQHLSRVQQFSDSESGDESKSDTESHVICGKDVNNKKQTSVIKSDVKQKNEDKYSSDSDSDFEQSFEKNKKMNMDIQVSGLSINKSQQEKMGYDNINSDQESDDDVDFGDQDAWEDESKDDDDWEAQFMKSKSKKIAAFAKSKATNGKDTEDIEVESTERSETPPTSKLMTKLFPKLKHEKPKINKHQEQKLEQSKQVEIGNGVQAKMLQDKLAELECEIERFRGENSTLEKLRKEREEGLEHLKREMNEFQKQKEDELKRIQEYKNEETRKLKREKKVFEDYQKTMRSMPNKKEREEIEMLKQQISDLQDEMKRKEQRWTSSTTRLRDRIEQLEQENTELRDEVKVLEKRRLDAWQQREGSHPLASSSKSKSDSLTANTDATDITSTTASQLKKSVSGPQISTRVAPQMSAKLPQPQKPLPAKPMVQKDNDLRLSTTAEIMKISSDTMSEGSEVIHPEDSASNVLSRISKESGTLHPRSNLLKSSQESSKSDEANNNSRKSMTRKKAVTLSISNAVEKGDGQYEEIQHTDGKVERIYTNGAREILFSNGTRKQVSADGQSIIVSFFNGDIKQILPDQRVVYYYSDAQTSHTTYPDGLEILQFPNQQVEKHYPDGTKEITFPDQTVKYLFPNGIEESIFHDGTVIRIEKNGDKTMEFPNGQREIHTGQYKRREYPDGTVKTVYPDGRQETRYSSGRIRVKDKAGTVIVDKRV